MSEVTYLLKGENFGVLAVSPGELEHLGLMENDVLTPAELLLRADGLPVSEWWLRNLIADLCTYDQPVIHVQLDNDDYR